MPTVRRSRTIAAPPEQVWEMVHDPHHLPRWWPRVSRVEGVDQTAFTEVLASSRGRIVRADWRLLDQRAPGSVAWEQELGGTPFARILSSSRRRIELRPAGERAGTHVTIELRQTLAGGRLPSHTIWLPRLGGLLARRAAVSTAEQALDGLARCLAGP